MRFFQYVGIAWMAVCPLTAGTIADVSTHATQQMNSGDTLSFMVSNLSLHTAIDSVQFQFVTQWLDPSTRFAAVLMSRDGTVSIAFSTPLQVLSGTFQGSHYQGPISSIYGTLELQAGLSQQLFQNTRATLVLRDIGPPATLGLPGYTLQQDMTLSLTSGSISAGAFDSAVFYQGRNTLGFSSNTNPPPAPAPEGDSWALVAGAGVLLCICSRMLKRISYRGIQ